MLEKIGDFAEEMALRVSRRGLFGKLGVKAMAAVGALGALSAGVARAERPGSTCCVYYSLAEDDYSAFCVKNRKNLHCPTISGFEIIHHHKVDSCADCSTD